MAWRSDRCARQLRGCKVEGLIAGMDYRVQVLWPERHLGRIPEKFIAKPGETVDLGQITLPE